jgi:hypothetical protein
VRSFHLTQLNSEIACRIPTLPQHSQFGAGDYKTEKSDCGTQAGNDKDICVKEDKHDAEHKVAAEKCQALAGEAKDACIAAAKAKYGIK